LGADKATNLVDYQAGGFVFIFLAAYKESDVKIIVLHVDLLGSRLRDSF
jgi:hypothetical protein